MSHGRFSLGRSAESVFRSSGFVPVLAVGALLGTLYSLAVGDWPRALGALVIVPYWGYQVTLSRSALMGGVELPPMSGWRTLLWRGLCAGVLLAGVAVPFVILALLAWVAFFAALHLDGVAVATKAMLPLLALMLLPLSVVMVASVSRYVAFDRVREGFRLMDAGRRMSSHRSESLRMIGIYALVLIALMAVRYTVLAQVGLATRGAREAALGGLLAGALSSGLVLIGIELLLAALTVSCVLVVSHLLGQYASILYTDDSRVGSA